MKYKIFSWLLVIPFTISSFAGVNIAQANQYNKSLPLMAEDASGFYYVEPMSGTKYKINNSQDMLKVIRWTALGISNENLKHIKINPDTYSGLDTDQDGLADKIETAIGTDVAMMDSDGDGHSDLMEIKNNYNPLGSGNIVISQSLGKLLAGKILLQVESFGEAWYVHPTTYERHYLGSSQEAYNLFQAISIKADQVTLDKFSTNLNLVEVASSAGIFKTLLSAANAAGLVETLSNEGPFTVFAPTDEAFAKVPAETLEALLADKEALTKVLTYHVVSGKKLAKDIVTMSSLNSLQGEALAIKLKGTSVMVANANVIKTDILASNAVIHVIDSVMLPKDLTINKNNMKNIVETAQGAGTFNTLLTAATAAGLVETLSNGGPFTVFAPTDEAFAKLPAGTIDALLKDKEALKNILLYHVVSGKVMAADVVKLTEATTLNGAKVMVDVKDGVKINNSMVTATDIIAQNGVIHVIDTVLLP